MLALIFAALVGPAAPMPSVADLVARHRHALGRVVSTTAHWSGTLESAGVVERFEVTADYTGRYTETWTTPLGKHSEGSDGTTDWTDDIDGNVESHPTTKSFSFENALVRLNDFRIDDAGQVSVSGPVTIDTRQAYALKVIEAESTVTLYIDTGSALLDGADVADHVVRYHKYRTFDGMPVPTVIEDTANGSTAKRTIDSVTFGVPVAGAFNIPAAREPAYPAGIDEVTTTFDSPRGLVIVHATINAKPVRLLIDTGSSSSVLDADVAKRLGLVTAGSARVEGATEIAGTYARVDTLGVAGISFSPFVVESIPLKLPALISHEGIDGILGYDFLAHVVARIAYFSHELRLVKPPAFVYAGNGTVVTLDLTHRVPNLQASTGSGDPGTFTVDTGSDQGLVLYSQFATAHSRDFVDPFAMSDARSSGVGGEFPTRSAVISEFTLGQFTVSNVPTEIVVRPTGAFSPGASNGLIGAKLLQDFRAVFLDYRGKRLILER